MDIAPETIAAWERRYGVPRVWNHTQPVAPEDYEGIKSSQHGGRAHDITLYIEAEGRIAVIAKHFYHPDLYRAPSGGLDPGESLETGAVREAYEETGLHIRLESYLLRANVTFLHENRRIDWCTHVFSATTDDRTMAPIDTGEIRSARWADPAEFAGFAVLMRQSTRGGFHYRAALHEQVAALHPLFQRR